MVITDIPFDAKEKVKNSRYSYIRRPESVSYAEDPDEESAANRSKEYAAFLKELERNVGSEGFLDSGKYTHPYNVAEKKRTGTPRPSSRNDVVKLLDAVSISVKASQDKRDHDKRIKIIEDHMWQYKQQERELKRAEGDILKKRYAVRHALRDYENNIRKQRLTADQTFNKGMEKYKKLEQAFLHEKVDTFKERAAKNEDALVLDKDQGRKTELQTTDLARRYRTVMDELELKQIEHNRLVSEYETKLRLKEHEQFELKKQLADFAVKLNLESSKGKENYSKSHEEKQKEVAERIKQDLEAKKSLDKQLGKGDENVKSTITVKRRLSADLTLTRSHLGLKNREEIRQLQDTRNELNDIAFEQRKLNEAAKQTELDLKTKHIENRLQVHEARKVQLMHHALVNRKERTEEQERVFSEKFQRRFADMARREHEDHLKHFQKMVTKGEEEEQKLYAKVKDAEYSRKKQEQAVRRLQQKLQQTKTSNAQELQKKLAEAVKREKDLEQKVLKEQAELDKLHSQREETYEKLLKHREMLKNDQFNLKKHGVEHTRLQRIADKKGAPADSFS